MHAQPLFRQATYTMTRTSGSVWLEKQLKHMMMAMVLLGSRGCCSVWLRGVLSWLGDSVERCDRNKYAKPDRGEDGRHAQRHRVAAVC